jgi:hypothetical protein
MTLHVALDIKIDARRTIGLLPQRSMFNFVQPLFKMTTLKSCD